MKLISKYEIEQLFNHKIRQTYFYDQINYLSMFLAQITYESCCLTKLTESFDYSIEGLLNTFPKHFDKKTAQLYGRSKKQPANQEMIANIAYANRMGNGDVKSGDGYRYRGRGPLQLTGKNNYAAFYADTDRLKLIDNPELIFDDGMTYLYKDIGLCSALWFWHKNNLNKLCPSVQAVTKAIKGSINTWEERDSLYQAYLKLLGN